MATWARKAFMEIRLLTTSLALAICFGPFVQSAKGQSPPVETRFGDFIENFWVDWGVSNRESRCFEQQSYIGQRRCLESKGYAIEVSSAKRCHLTVIERVPLKTGLPTTWDGKTVGKVVVSRAVELDLGTLTDGLIKKSGSQFFLPFEVPGPSAVIEKIAYSDDPQTWVPVALPPKASNLDLRGSEDEKRQAWLNARMQWAASVNRLGEFSLPIFGIVFEDLPNGRSFLQLVTASFDHAYWRGQQVQTKTSEFIQTVKDVLSQCRQ
jgi:hypothetical protein